MPLYQGPWPKVRWSNVMVGKDQNGAFTTNVQEYRGRAYCLDSAFTAAANDKQREVVRIAQQDGLRAVGFALMTGRISPSH